MDLNLGRLVIKMTVDQSGLAAGTAAVQGFEKKTITSINLLSQRLRTVGYLFSAVITAPMVAAGRSMFKAASEFEYSMQKIVGLTGVAQSTADQWGKSIMQIAKEYGRTPQELAEGLYFIASSGIQGAEALDVLRVSARAAASGLGETQAVADLVTSALNAYAGTGLTASQVTDQLVAAVRVGKAEADQFAGSIGSVLPYASKLSLGFDQVAGAMAAMTLTGASAANASTYLRNYLMRLIKPAEQSKDELEGLGSSFEELRNIVANEGLLASLERVNALTEKYGVETLGKIFPNIRSLLLVLSLTGKNSEHVAEIMNQVTNSTGDARTAWAKLADTIKTRYNKIIAELQENLISLGKILAEGFLPLLEKWVGRLRTVAERFNALSDSQKQNKLQWAAWIAASGPILLILSALIYSFSGLLNIINGVGRALIWLTSALKLTPLGGFLFVASAVTAIMYAFRKRGEEAKTAYDDLNKTLETVKKTMAEISQEAPNVNALDQLFAIRASLDQQLQAQKTLLSSYAQQAGLTPEQIARGDKWKRKGLFGTSWENAATTANDKITELQKALQEVNTLINTMSNSLIQDTNSINDNNKAVEKQIELITMLKDSFSVFEETKNWKSSSFGNMKGNLPEWLISPEETAGLGLSWQGDWESQSKALIQYNKNLQNQGKILQGLSKGFEEFFYNTTEGMRGMVVSMLKSIQLVLAKLISLFLLKTALGIIAPTTLGVDALTMWRKFVGVKGYAKGGIIPPGYPNDTYPAALSSGEAVLTPMQLQNLTSGRNIHITVDGEISGKTIALALRRANMYN